MDEKKKEALKKEVSELVEGIDDAFNSEMMTNIMTKLLETMIPTAAVLRVVLQASDIIKQNAKTNRMIYEKKLIALGVVSGRLTVLQQINEKFDRKEFGSSFALYSIENYIWKRMNETQDAYDQLTMGRESDA